MSLVWTLIIGLLVGIIAKLILPGSNGPRGLIWTALAGIAGSFVGSFLGQLFGFYRPGETAGFFGSIIGAIVVLYVWDFFMRKKPA